METLSQLLRIKIKDFDYNSFVKFGHSSYLFCCRLQLCQKPQLSFCHKNLPNLRNVFSPLFKLYQFNLQHHIRFKSLILKLNGF